MEPKAINTLVEEAELLKAKAKKEISNSLPESLQHLFSDNSEFFVDEVLAQWRREERFDELIEYVLYQYSERGGEVFWKQVLLDLRLKKDEERAIQMLEGLIPGRMELCMIAQKNVKRFPDNYLSAANLLIAKGEVLKVFYEMAYILENRSAREIDKKKIASIKSEVEKLIV